MGAFRSRTALACALFAAVGCGKKAAVADGGSLGGIGGGTGGAAGGAGGGVPDASGGDAPVTEGGTAFIAGRAFDDCTACDPLYHPNVEFCGANDACPALTSCFHLTADMAMCDHRDPSVAACSDGNSSHPDDCACNGLTCPADQDCVSTPDFSVAVARYNACQDRPCASASECTGDLSCTPGLAIQPASFPTDPSHPAVGRCFRPLCRTDAECTDSPAGRCAIALRYSASRGFDFSVRCVYQSPGAAPDPSWCAGTTVKGVRALPSTAGSFHICPDRER